MSTYFNNLVNNLLSNEPAYFVIEHAKNHGWYLFDILYNENQTILFWVKKLPISLSWISEMEAMSFLSIHTPIVIPKVKIIDIRDISWG